MADASLTQWLRAAAAGDRVAGDQAYALVYAELRRLAACQLRGDDAAATLTPTALVNEAYLRLAGGALAGLNDRRHFFNLIARAMRQTIVDHARSRAAEKRGGDLLRTGLDESIPDRALDPDEVLAIDQAFSALERQDAELAETFALRAFAGIDTTRIAELRGVTERTIQRDLGLARSYLGLALGRAP